MIAVLLTGLAWAISGLPEPTHRVGDHGHERVAVRDGTELRTVWTIPAGEGPFPTVMTRVPYPMGPILDYQCRLLVRRGYACVYQDVRGRGRSEGEWVPFVNEERDGQDAVAWVRGQSWSDGRVAWLGDSYLAAAGWTVAAGDPDGVSALVSRIFAPSLYTSAYEDGLLRHELITAWMAMMPDSRHNVLAPRRYHRALRHRPRTTLDEVAAGHPVPWYREWLEGEDPTAPIWSSGEAARFAKAAGDTAIPVLMVGGWSDAFVEAQIDAWTQLESRDRSTLVIGPWAHLGQSPSAVPLRGRGGRLAALQLPRVLDWLDVQMKGTESRYPESGTVTYVIGGDRWVSRADWPPPADERRFDIEAGLTRCDGTLVDGSAAPLEAPLTYTYDPEHPLPSRGGAGMLAGAVPLMNGVKPGFVRVPDRCERRDDVLRFESEPIGRPLHFAGTVRVELSVASSAPDTAFGFRLLEKRAQGPEILLREGFTTLALRDGGPRRAYEPHSRVTVVADAAPLEAELHEGSRLVLVITSSSFPAVEAHPNVAGPLAEAATTQIAHQTVFAGSLFVPEVRAD